MSEPLNWTYETFIKVRDQFDLGDLVTEQRHPLSANLAETAMQNVPEALLIFKSIDSRALESMQVPENLALGLRADCLRVWKNNRRVFISGCGSTGRMAFVLEKIGNSIGPGPVVAVMAAADVALVHSVAGFEDSDNYGAKQLEEAGFKNGDLLIACTEGGETAFVLGTVNAALKISKESAYFVFCNPTATLTEKIKRSRQVIENSRVCSVELNVGPMALSGSTRLQATTAQMLFVGWTLVGESNSFADFKNEILRELNGFDFSILARLIETESSILHSGKTVVYKSSELPLAVFTDVAERGPTFSLPFLSSFSESKRKTPQFIIAVPGTAGAEDAWKKIFGRSVKSLEWKGLPVSRQLEKDYLMQFDWSEQALRNINGIESENIFSIECTDSQKSISLHNRGQSAEFKFKGEYSLLKANLFAKIILNSLSTLVMGRYGRFQKNLMTFVRPTNGKLIDRSMRYVRWLLEDDGIKSDDHEILKILFARLETDSANNESVVLNTYRQIKSKA